MHGFGGKSCLGRGCAYCRNHAGRNREHPDPSAHGISPDIFLVIAHYRATGLVAARRSQRRSQHVDNPVDRVKFGMPPLHHRVVEAIESLDKGISLSATIPTLIALRIDDKPGVGTTDRDPV
jgi:hypothetical protein